MRKLLLFILLIATIPLIGQNIYTSTIAAKDSIGSAIHLGKGEVPNVMWTSDTLRAVADSSAESKTIKFYVYRGDASGYATDSLTNWKLLTVQEDTTAYVLPFKTGVYMPLNISTEMHTLIGASPTGGKSAQVYIKPYIPTGVSASTSVKIGTIFLSN